MRKSGIQGVLVDEAFRPYVFSWLAEHIELPSLQGTVGEDTTPSAKDMERWIHRSHSALNGESPLQASSHDFGKRKLRDLIDGMLKQGADVEMLRQRLGL